MSDKSSTAASDHSEASFDIIFDDANSGSMVHVPNPNGMDRVVDKLVDVLSGTSEVLAQNQVVLSNLRQTMEAAFKDARQKEKKQQTLQTSEVNVLESQQQALSEEFSVKRAAMRDVLCDLLNDANLTTSAAATHSDMNTQIGLLRTGFEQTRMALQIVTDTVGEMLLRMNINEERLEALTKDNDARDRRMTGISEELGRKCAAVGSLEKTVEVAPLYEILLLKGREQEKDRQMAALAEKVQELEERQEMDNRDRVRGIDELKEVVADEQAKVKALEELVESQDRQLAALTQNDKWLEALTKVRDRRMTELTAELGLKSSAIVSSEKAVEDARSEILLLKDHEKEKNRQTTAMSELIQDLEESHAADSRDVAREIDDLTKAIGDAKGKVEALEELVQAQDQQLAALAQNAQDLMTLQERNMYEKARDQARHMSALNCAEVSDNSMPGVQSGQRTPLSLSMAEELVNDKNELKSFFMNEVQLGKQLLAEGMHEEGLEHHSNAIVLCNEPAQALQFFRRILLPEQFELLIRALPAAKQRMGLKYPGLSSMLEAADKANAAGEVCGLTVSLLAANGYFLCGNYGDAPATVTGISANQDSVRFTVENAGNGKVALKSCGHYLSVMADGSAVTCDRRTRNKWTHFDWIKHDSGEVSLRGANGKYVSSETPAASLVTCDRDKAGPWERFTVV